MLTVGACMPRLPSPLSFLIIFACLATVGECRAEFGGVSCSKTPSGSPVCSYGNSDQPKVIVPPYQIDFPRPGVPREGSSQAATPATPNQATPNGSPPPTSKGEQSSVSFPHARADDTIEVKNKCYDWYSRYCERRNKISFNFCTNSHISPEVCSDRSDKLVENCTALTERSCGGQ